MNTTNTIQQGISDTMSQQYMLVSFTTSKWSAKKLDRSVSTEAERSYGAVAGSLGAVKSLMVGANKELKATYAAMDLMRAYVYTHTLPWTMANDQQRKRGPRLLANIKVMTFMERMAEMERLYEDKLSQLILVYDTRVQQAIAHLAGLAKSSDYPSAMDLRSQFAISTTYSQLPSTSGYANMTGVPDDILASLSTELVVNQQAMKTQAVNEAWSAMIKPVSHLIEQLSKDEGRKHISLIGNISSIVDAASGFNLDGDPNMDVLIAKMREKLCAFDIRVLRNNESIKQEVLSDAKVILRDLKQASGASEKPVPCIASIGSTLGAGTVTLPDVDDLY